MAASLERAKQHDIAGALAALDRVPPDERDDTFYLLEAALLLSVGRVDEALKIINQAIARNERAGLAYALRAVIEVVKNEKAKALGRCKTRRRARAESCGAQNSLVLCATGEFRPEGRSRHLIGGDHAPAGKRLPGRGSASFGSCSGTASERAKPLRREFALRQISSGVHLVFGFAALTEFRTKMAREAFERAIELDSADPLARFGLGLAIIRDGALAEGRRYLEMAVGLDFTNSLLRSYLGKAYFEEKRDPLDARQFALAKQLDPLDPTPYLYDAIRLQSINRPVDAMLSMEKSIELNDNRAVYRSSQLLDSDRATRQANLAQIYDGSRIRAIGPEPGLRFPAARSRQQLSSSLSV